MRTAGSLKKKCSIFVNAIVALICGLPLQLPAQNRLSEMEIYRRVHTIIDMTNIELLQVHPDVIQDLHFSESQQELGPLLKSVGENVEKFFRYMPNTISRERVRRERLKSNGSVDESVTQNYYYTAAMNSISGWEEGRTDSRGQEILHEPMSGMSFLTTGFAGALMYFHPKHQFGCRFRYLGRQSGGSRHHVVAFAQKPGVTDIVGTFMNYSTMTPVTLLYQGFAWVDPDSYQIVRLRQDLLAPRMDAFIGKASSDIAYGEVHFQSVAAPFWLPQEVVVILGISGQQFRNQHRYSDYEVFTITVEQKINPPVVKK